MVYFAVWGHTAAKGKTLDYDIIAWQMEGNNIALAQSDNGDAWLMAKGPEVLNQAQSFLEFLHSIPQPLKIGVVDPTGKILNFRSAPLH